MVHNTGNKLYYTMNLLQQEIIEYEFTQQEIIKLKNYFITIVVMGLK